MWFLSGFLFLASIYLFFIFGIHFFGCLALAWVAVFLLVKVMGPWRVVNTAHGPRAVKHLRILDKTLTKDKK